MEDTLKNILNSYREYTLRIIENIQNDNLDSLQQLVEERQNLVEEAMDVNFDKEKIKQIYMELKIEELDKELNLIMEKKLSLIKAKMEEIDKSKVANRLYKKNIYANVKIFNKKI